MNPFRLLIDVFAVYRLTKLVLEDEIVSEPREWLLARYDPSQTKLGYLLTCPWCVSVWAGLFIFGLRRFAPDQFTDLLSSTLASSAATGLAYEHLPQ